MPLLDVMMTADDLPAVGLRRSTGGLGPVRPRLPTKNQYWSLVTVGSGRAARASRVHSNLARAFWPALGHAIARKTRIPFDGQSGRLAYPCVDAGWCEIEITAWAKRWNRGLGDVIVPDLDADACSVTLLDALKEVGAIDDDARFLNVVTRSRYSEHAPMLRFTIRTINDADLFGAEYERKLNQ